MLLNWKPRFAETGIEYYHILSVRDFILTLNPRTPMIYKFKVDETIALEKIYEVEAVSLDEAVEKAKVGDTVKEKLVRELMVSSRFIVKNLTEGE